MTDESKMLIELLNSIREEIREIKQDLNSLREELHRVTIDTLNKADKNELAKKLDKEEFKKYKKNINTAITILVIFCVLVSVKTNTFGEVFEALLSKF